MIMSMASTLPDTIYGNTIKYLVLVTLFIIFITLSIASYSTTGYTLVKYPGVDGEEVICVEGEVHPTNQSITIINSGDEATINPYVTVNGVTHLFNMTVSDVGVRKRVDTLKLGCNNISYGSDTDSSFKVKLEYLSHWRPVVKMLEIGNLKVGHSVRYFIATADWKKRKIVKSRLNITDITKNMNDAPIFDSEFNGSAVRFKMEQPGNHKATMQVYDGYVWSDVYEASFTSHVIVTDEQKAAYPSEILEDDPVLEHPAMLPAEIRPDDKEPTPTFKRLGNGMYMLAKRVMGLGRNLMLIIKANLPV
ncbi:MAG: hypothetical protein GF416_00485 [Candidatus Altiarchaeales archaeon]|nr:hypothetical protein [Candidatus Altiarchaeales archaeon]MBD3415595.1 hypothetical protein [Candidatus Altiarchaeales archaeon]